MAYIDWINEQLIFIIVLYKFLISTANLTIKSEVVEYYNQTQLNDY